GAAAPPVPPLGGEARAQVPGARPPRHLMPQPPSPPPILRPPPGIRFLIFRRLLAESDEGGGNLPRLPNGRAVPLAETLRPFLPLIGLHSRPCSLHPCSFFSARSLHCNTSYVTIPPEGGVSQGGVTMPRKRTGKIATSVRLTPTAKRLLRLLATSSLPREER